MCVLVFLPIIAMIVISYVGKANPTERHLKWKNLGHVLAGGNGDEGDIAGKPERKQAYELDKSI